MTATDRPAMSDPEAAPGDGDAVAVALAGERDFLLRSLADLDAEYAAGELTEHRYRDLRDRYTVRAAAVLRALERLDGAPPLATDGQPARRGPRRLGLIAVCASVLAVGGVLLSNALQDRRPGQTITGNAQSMTADLGVLERAAAQRPDDAETQLAYASALLADRQLVDALRAFDTAARLDPTNPVPKAYGGWIVFLAGLTDEALTRLDAAVAVDPAYPDARFFRGMVLLRGRQDEAAALADWREYLRLAADGPERQQVQALVDRMTASSTPAK